MDPLTDGVCFSVGPEVAFRSFLMYFHHALIHLDFALCLPLCRCFLLRKILGLGLLLACFRPCYIWFARHSVQELRENKCCRGLSAKKKGTPACLLQKQHESFQNKQRLGEGRYAVSDQSAIMLLLDSILRRFHH